MNRNFATKGPGRLNLQPHGTLTPGISLIIISLSTNEPASFKYSTLVDMEFDEMQSTFGTTGGTVHSSQVGAISDGATYSYYCRCRDDDGNVNTDDFQITIRIGEEASGLADSFYGQAFSIQENNLPSGDVNFSVSQIIPGDFILRVFDILGRQVCSYRQSDTNSGIQNIIWNNTDQTGASHNQIFCVALSYAGVSKCKATLFMK